MINLRIFSTINHFLTLIKFSINTGHFIYLTVMIPHPKLISFPYCMLSMKTVFGLPLLKRILKATSKRKF